MLAALSFILEEKLLHSEFSARYVLLRADGAAKIGISNLEYDIALD